MNKHYTDLVAFLTKCSEDDSELIFQLIHGEVSPFSNSLVEEDEVTVSLTKPDDSDVHVVSILKTVLISLKLYVEKTIAEHLQGGKYWDAGEHVWKATVSAPRHNKNPERVFGLLDFLVHNRPNSSALVNEAVVMYVYNHTSEYLKQMDQEKFDSIIHNVKLRTKEMVKVYKEREDKIFTKHLELKRERAMRDERRKNAQLTKKKKLN